MLSREVAMVAYWFRTVKPRDPGVFGRFGDAGPKDGGTWAGFMMDVGPGMAGLPG